MSRIWYESERDRMSRGLWGTRDACRLQQALRRGDTDIGDGRRLISDDALRLAEHIVQEHAFLLRKVAALTEQARRWKREARR